MERQYIGARYVPKFADPIEWNSGMTYEPLTIVTYLGASYTSKKAVPAGVLPTNSSYWVVTGNYNAQVEEYRQAVEGVKQDIDTVNERINKEHDGKWIFLADSYGLTSDWPTKLSNLIGLSSDKYWNLSVTGTGFWDNSWLNMLKEWVTNNPGEVNKVKHIVVAGGYNDSNESGVNVISANRSAFVRYCKTTFNNVRVHLAYIGWALDTAPNLDGHTRHYRAVAQQYYAVVGYDGGEYLTGCEGAIQERALMTADGIHPSAGGGAHIATHMYNALMSGYGGITKWDRFGSLVPVSGGISGSIKQDIVGQNVYTHFDLALNGADVTLVAHDWYKLGDVVLPCGNTIPEQTLMITYAKSLVYKMGSFSLKIENDELYIRCNDITTDGVTYSGCTFDTLNNFKFDVVGSVVGN